MSEKSQFPYIEKLHVDNCYAYQDFNIDMAGPGAFRHLVLTGKNGSGKSTILKHLDRWFGSASQGIDTKEHFLALRVKVVNHQATPTEQEEYLRLEAVLVVRAFTTPGLPPVQNMGLLRYTDRFIYVCFQTIRKVDLDPVATVSKDTDLLDLIKSTDSKTKKKPKQEGLARLFKQYMVNKKVHQAFSLLDSSDENMREAKRIEEFFDRFEGILRKVFSDEELTLKFVKESFEFYLVLWDKREITFNQLPDGFSALLGVVFELLIRVDMIRKIQKNFTLDPEGLVLIDEPETHLHLEMQYLAMPLLTELFPKIQFIVATHSPAVISSIPQAVVYDLTRQAVSPPSVVASSFSELMLTHFGLDHQYSPIARALLDEINAILQSDQDATQKHQLLADILEQKQELLTPTFKLEIEALLNREAS